LAARRFSPAELAATPGQLAWSWEASYPEQLPVTQMLRCRKWIRPPFQAKEIASEAT
jgi:hypothetical protein